MSFFRFVDVGFVYMDLEVLDLSNFSVFVRIVLLSRRSGKTWRHTESQGDTKKSGRAFYADLRGVEVVAY